MSTPSDVVGQSVREVRRRRGMTVAELAERCAKLGVPELTEQALYNIEAGRRDPQGRRRRQVAVDELLVLAYALDIAPVHLLVRTGDRDEPYHLTPTVAEPALAVHDWIVGLPSLGEADVSRSDLRRTLHRLLGTTEEFQRTQDLLRLIHDKMLEDGTLEREPSTEQERSDG